MSTVICSTSTECDKQPTQELKFSIKNSPSRSRSPFLTDVTSHNATDHAPHLPAAMGARSRPAVHLHHTEAPCPTAACLTAASLHGEVSLTKVRPGEVAGVHGDRSRPVEGVPDIRCLYHLHPDQRPRFVRPPRRAQVVHGGVLHLLHPLHGRGGAVCRRVHRLAPNPLLQVPVCLRAPGGYHVLDGYHHLARVPV